MGTNIVPSEVDRGGVKFIDGAKALEASPQRIAGHSARAADFGRHYIAKGAAYEKLMGNLATAMGNWSRASLVAGERLRSSAATLKGVDETNASSIRGK